MSVAAATGTALAVLLAWTAPAGAQVDHYKCFRARDADKVFRRATVDLTPLQQEFAAQRCSIKPGSKQVCIPSSKTVTEVVDGVDAPFPADELVDFQLCYKLKCPREERGPLEVSDQLGTRSIEKFRATKLCVPAID